MVILILLFFYIIWSVFVWACIAKVYKISENVKVGKRKKQRKKKADAGAGRPSNRPVPAQPTVAMSA